MRRKQTRFPCMQKDLIRFFDIGSGSDIADQLGEKVIPCEEGAFVFAIKKLGPGAGRDIQTRQE